MTVRPHRRWSVAAATALAGAGIAIGLVAPGPYPVSTALLVLACGSALLPFLPDELARPSVRASVVPALGITAFTVLLTTISIAGIRLTEVSIGLAVAALVVGAALTAQTGPLRDERSRDSSASHASEAAVLGGLGLIFVFALASAWDVVGPFPPPGVDWGHYLLYADEVEAQGRLLIEDPYAVDDGRLFADSPGVGALYGSVRILDGLASSSLSYGVILISALSTLTVYAAAGALWSTRAGLIAASAWAVAPIHVDPIRWHGVGTNLALVFVPLVLLALGLMYRGVRGWRVVVLLAAALLGVAVTHSTSAFVVAFLVATALVVDVAHHAVRSFAVTPSRPLRRWWREGLARPVLAAVALAAAAGAGVVVHLRAQAADLGSPVDYRLFEPDWLSWRVVVDYYSLAFLALTATSLALVVSSRTVRRDPALLALAALAVACAVVAELWRAEIPFEYRRAVYYLGLGMAMVIGVGSSRLAWRPAWAVGYAVALLYVAHVSVGLGLPERLLSGRGEAKGEAAREIVEFAQRLESGQLPDASLVVADRCHNFVVPYLLRRPTIIAFEPWQVGFERRVPLADQAAKILAGNREGRRLAESLGVGYVVANPSCTPGLPERLGGSVVVATDDLVVVDLRSGET